MSKTDKSEYYQQLFHRYAGQAMQGLITTDEDLMKPTEAAKWAIAYADALLDAMIKRDGAK